VVRSEKLEASCSKRHYSDFLFHLCCVHHHNRVPRAAVEEGTFRTLAGALVAADAENRVDLDATKRRIVLVGNPEHAIFNRAIFYARGRTRAPGAAFGDNGQLLGFLFASGKEALGPGFVFELVGHHPDESP